MNSLRNDDWFKDPTVENGVKDVAHNRMWEGLVHQIMFGTGDKYRTFQILSYSIKNRMTNAYVQNNV